jgi:hypothetical protein
MAAFVWISFSSANCKHWNSERSANSGAQVVVTDMPSHPPVGYDGPYVTNGEADPLLVEFAVTPTAYSMPSNLNQCQPWNMAFARVVKNEVTAGDPRVSRGRMI